MRGSPHVLEDIVDDLRSYEALVELLPGPEAIYEGHPTEDRGYSASVTLTTVTNNSTPHRGVMERTFRVQATVTATRSWREWYDNRDEQPSSISQMGRILFRVAERLDRAEDLPEIAHGSEGGLDPEPLDDGRLAVAEDWRLSGWYLEDESTE